MTNIRSSKFERLRTTTTKQKRKKYAERVQRGFANWNMEDGDEAKLNALLGIRGRAENLLWSDMHALARASGGLTAMMLKLFDAAPAERRFVWLTFTDDHCMTSDRTPVLLLAKVQGKAYRALKDAGLNAIMGTHLHPLTNYPAGGDGRTILLHKHAIAWTDNPVFDFAAWERQVNQSRAWNNALGGKPLKVVTVLDRQDVRAYSRYMCLPPFSAKYRKPSKIKPGKFLLKGTLSGYRPEFALRSFEGMSQVALTEVFSGVGEGHKLAQDLRTLLIMWHRARSKPVVVPAEFDVWAMWARLRSANGSKRFLPYRLHGGGVVPRALAPQCKVQLSKRKPLPRVRCRKGPPKPLGPPKFLKFRPSGWPRSLSNRQLNASPDGC